MSEQGRAAMHVAQYCLIVGRFVLAESSVQNTPTQSSSQAVSISGRENERKRESEEHVAREKERLAERTSGRVRWRFIERMRKRKRDM